MGKEQDLLKAAQDGDSETIERLLGGKKERSRFASFKRGPAVNLRDPSGYTPLHYAAVHGHIEACQVLLKHDANANARDNKGSCPLHLAAWGGHTKVAQLLLTGKTSNTRASANSQALNGETALHNAAQHGNHEVLTLLLKFTADPTKRNNAEETPLDLAAQYGRTQCVEILLQHSPKLLELISPHQTPLHLAARNGHADVVNLLIEHGMDVNVESENGTALHEAALYGKTEVVKTLLHYNIEVHKRNAHGQTAMEILDTIPGKKAQEIKAVLSSATNQIISGTVQAIAIMDYAPSVYDEAALSFRKGDVIAIIEKAETGWWTGSLGGETGVFPHTYVEILETGSNRTSLIETSSSSISIQLPAEEAAATPAVESPASTSPFSSGSLTAAEPMRKRTGSFNPFLAQMEDADGDDEVSAESIAKAAQALFFGGGDASTDSAGAAAVTASLFGNAAGDAQGSAAEPQNPFFDAAADLFASGETTPSATPGPIVEAAVPTTVDEWLQAQELPQYAQVFAAAGFDSLRFLPLVTEEDLERIGISNASHRQKMVISLQPLAVQEPFPDAASVEGWLCGLDLSQYAQNLQTGGVTTLEQASRIWDDSLKDDFGVSLPGHVHRLKAALAHLRNHVKVAARPATGGSKKSQVQQGGCEFPTGYLGSVVASGPTPAQAGILKMKNKSKQRNPKAITLSITTQSVKFVDPTSQMVIIDHPIDSISSSIIDEEDSCMLAYVTKDQRQDGSFKNYCHTFAVDTPTLASTIVDTLQKACNGQLPASASAAQPVAAAEPKINGKPKTEPEPELEPADEPEPASDPSPEPKVEQKKQAEASNGSVTADPPTAASKTAGTAKSPGPRRAKDKDKEAAKEKARAEMARLEAKVKAKKQAAARKKSQQKPEAPANSEEGVAGKLAAIDQLAQEAETAAAEAEQEMERQEKESKAMQAAQAKMKAKEEARKAREADEAADKIVHEREAAGEFVPEEEKQRLHADTADTEKRVGEMTFSFSFGGSDSSSTDPAPKENEAEKGAGAPAEATNGESEADAETTTKPAAAAAAGGAPVDKEDRIKQLRARLDALKQAKKKP